MGAGGKSRVVTSKRLWMGYRCAMWAAGPSPLVGLSDGAWREAGSQSWPPEAKEKAL